MKTLNTFFLLLLFSFHSFAGSGNAEDFTKKWNKTFQVNATSKLSISNKYGDIKFVPSDGNTLKIDVVITVDKKSDRAAQSLLESISIRDKVSGDDISIKTNFEKTNNTGNSEMSIDYVVSAPKYLMLDITNAFGDVFIGEQLGNAAITVEYGALKATSFNGNDNTIILKFSNAEIAYFEKGKMNLSYSDIELKSANELDLKSAFSDIELDKAHDLVVYSEYDDLELGDIGALKVDAKFTDCEIELLRTKCKAAVEFGDFEIDQVSKSFEKIKVHSQFGSVEIEMESGSSYSFDCKSEMGSIDLPSGSVVQTNIKETLMRHKIGIVGKNPEERIVSVHVQQGSIELD